MRQLFFMGLLIAAVVTGVAYFCWSILAALYHDWVLGRHVGTIKAQSESQREKRAEDARHRLDNGCEHAFGETFGGFPMNACHKCGLEQVRPAGSCDHVWKVARESVPCSYCEKCGKRYVSPGVRL